MRRVSSWALVALLLASGCSGGGEDQPASERPGKTSSLDFAGKSACNEFARWLAGDEDPTTRADVATRVDDLARDSRSGALADKSELLRKADVINSNENWALAADAFAYECDVLGWTPADAQ
jgi:hypothetical protein